MYHYNLYQTTWSRTLILTSPEAPQTFTKNYKKNSWMQFFMVNMYVPLLRLFCFMKHLFKPKEKKEISCFVTLSYKSMLKCFLSVTLMLKITTILSISPQKNSPYLTLLAFILCWYLSSFKILKRFKTKSKQFCTCCINLVSNTFKF